MMGRNFFFFSKVHNHGGRHGTFGYYNLNACRPPTHLANGCIVVAVAAVVRGEGGGGGGHSCRQTVPHQHGNVFDRFTVTPLTVTCHS